ncbi:MAG: hypothetical protein UR66_C0008G0013 [Candidatus Moranbacteria bacterium GW2011_GWE1_35_17]|nr:MAG: hypothetical protein UR66_C0008G0013 [Candidatus Moranbacteria bacterium GW2011_GWE1_35_17]KKP81442.1 MAG: hypothetical protein UR82_C0062G0004 [Candidatus Moranbacteria bacterium GW2011_GWF1_35_5]
MKRPQNYKKVEIALKVLLESSYLISSLETDFQYMRRHDGVDGERKDEHDSVQYLSLYIDFVSDVSISIPPKKKDDEWRFRNRGGGGQSPRTFRALVVLMEAIRRDNEKSLVESKIYSDENISEALDFILEDSYWIETVDIGKLYKQRQDDIDGSDEPIQYLALGIDSSGNSDIHIAIYPGKHRELRFRNSFGGGKSERVRKALIIVMEAIRRDNEKNPEP